MHNPWHDLPPTPPFVLPADYEPIQAFNENASPRHQIHLELPPEPYLGNPDAPIILLNLNPGFSAADAAFYAQDIVRDLNARNLRHEPLDYPFYLFDPRIDQEKAGAAWWSRILKQPIQLAGKRKVANAFCCIEYFPYHSRRYKSLSRRLDSQKYGFELVRAAIDREAVIIGMRSLRRWRRVVPALQEYEQLFTLNSPQNPAISARNCPRGFPLIKQILDGTTDGSGGLSLRKTGTRGMI